MSQFQGNLSLGVLPSLPSPSTLLPLLSTRALQVIPKFDIKTDLFTLLYAHSLWNDVLVKTTGATVLFHHLLAPSGILCTLTFFLMYVLLVRVLRYRRLAQLHKRYNYPTRASMAKMTDFEAWEIQRTMSQLEFPFTFEKSLQFALFRTYGIPTISSTLMKTKQFSNPRYSGKRYVDTCVLIGEFIVHDPASIRSRIGLSRTKYLHHSYRRSGAVQEQDMLYTLSLFATEPLRFIEKYEWRSPTDLERCAMGVFWKSVGDALDIDYSKFFPSTQQQDQKYSSPSFMDGLHWLEKVTAWAQEYEKRAMVPAQSNKDTADQTTAVLTYSLPQSLKFLGNWFVSSMMDERLLLAMMYEKAPWFASQFFSLVYSIRKTLLRYLALPRSESMRVQNFTNEPDPTTGAYHVVNWQAEPFYVKPTLWNRWLSPAAMSARLLGFPLPGDQGDKYYPQGYDLADMGPKMFEGKGKEYQEKQMGILEKERRGQCPFLR